MTIDTYKDKWQYLTNVCLNITNNCNLQCKYCFVCQKPEYMTLETGIDIINYLHKNLLIKKEKGYCQNNQKCRISFFGGEPLLLYNEIIVPLIKYIKEKKIENDFLCTITTNGTLLDIEKIKFFKDNNIEILLSLDGDKITQDINRPMKNLESSFDKIINILPILQNNFPNLSMRATIYEQTVGELFNNYLFAIKHNFFAANFIPDERHPWKQESYEILKQEIKKIFLFNIRYILKYNKLPIHCSILEQNILRIIQNDIKNKELDIFQHCGLGTVNGSIDYKGNIFSCQEQDSRYIIDVNSNIFYIGNIYEGIDKNKHINLLNKYEKDKEKDIINENISFCNNCNRKIYCFNDLCLSLTYDLYQNFSIANKTHCIFLQEIHKNSLAFLKILNDNNKLKYLLTINNNKI